MCLSNSFRDEEAGEIPVGFVVMRPGAEASESSIIDFVAIQVRMIIFNPNSLKMLATRYTGAK